MSVDRRLDEKISKAYKRERYYEEKDWKKTVCPYCQKSVQYIPKLDFSGIVKCPHCLREFKVPSLDGWVR